MLFAVKCVDLLLSVFAVGGEVQEVLQNVFALTVGQVVEEVLWYHLCEPRNKNPNNTPSMFNNNKKTLLNGIR